MARWTKGQSGNPIGRPKLESTKVREALLEAAPAVVKKLIELALAGEPVAMKEFMARVLPALKSETARVRLDIAPGPLIERAESVLALAAAGGVPMDVASEYVSNILKIVGVEAATVLRQQLDLLLSERSGDTA